MAIGDASSIMTKTTIPLTSGNGNLVSGATTIPSIDHNHPLFLQPTDTPGHSLISSVD